MIISLIKSKFLLKQFKKKNKYLWDECFLILLLWKSEPRYIQIVYQNFISGNLLIYKLVHTSRGNRYLK